MYSTSSSECVCGECSRYSNRLDNGYGRNYRKTPRTPFYPIMGEPLVYCAQVQQPASKKHKKENGKGNANCFVKAFRWYTKDHIPSQTSDSPNTNTDMAGFATWLDAKYNEFIHDSQLNQALYHLKLKQTSTIEAERIADNAVCEPCATKKIMRSRRPWGKRRRINSKEAGDVTEKSSKSFEYILQPKDLTHPESECCHPTPTSCCNQSTAMFVSNDMEGSKKTMAVKSLSLTSVRKDKNYEPIDTVNLQEGTKPEKEVDKNKKDETSESETKAVEKSKALTVKKAPKRKRTREISCQCIEETEVKVDAQTQCYSETETTRDVTEKYNTDPMTPTQTREKKLATSEIKTSFVVETQENDTIRNVHRTHQSNQYPDEGKIKVDAHSQFVPRKIPCSCSIDNNIRDHQEAGKHSYNVPRSPAAVKETDSFIVENLATLTKTTRSFTIFVNDAAQTSDHSISIEKDTIHKYPLFMKIVCADKLNEELNL